VAWTKELPTEAGHYWIKDPYSSGDLSVINFDGGEYWGIGTEESASASGIIKDGYEFWDQKLEVPE